MAVIIDQDHVSKPTGADEEATARFIESSKYLYSPSQSELKHLTAEADPQQVLQAPSPTSTGLAIPDTSQSQAPFTFFISIAILLILLLLFVGYKIGQKNSKNTNQKGD
ncbi:MAG: hypothetical protein WC045_04050 [Patescibacteria group bacterium]